MRCLEKNIFIIVPCYNEERRLSTSLSVFTNAPYRFIFVNDGSSDNTEHMLDSGVTAPNLHISLKNNSGKAEAIRKGWEFLKTLDEYAEAQWIGYWDADLATPIEEVAHFLEQAELNGGADAVYGSRVLRLGSIIKRSPLRHFLGRMFCTLISLLFGLKSYDTQCGAKLFNKAAAQEAFAESFISEWIFDVEIILRLKSFRQLECPLQKWEDVKGSKIDPFRSLIPVFKDICKIFLKYRR